MENDLTIEEIIRLCLLYRSKKGVGTTRTGIVKSLYELKKNLPENNSIKEKLAYYWFKAGPFSEYVVAALDKMISKNIVSKISNSDYELYHLNPDYFGKRLYSHDSELIQAREILSKIIDNMRPFSIDQEIKSQYENDAPSQFYPKFKLDFLKALELHSKRLEPQIDQQNKKDSNDQRENLLKLVLESTSSLPYDSLFSNFKRVYFDFETAFLRVLKMDVNTITPYYVQLIKDSVELSTKIWDTFAYGARIMKHDPSYDAKMDEWKKTFANEILQLQPEVNAFYTRVLQIAKPKDYDERVLKLSDFVKDILEIRNTSEIDFINFQTVPDSSISAIVGETIQHMPEWAIFTREGQLDWSVTKELDDKQLADIINQCTKNNTVYVAFSEKGTKTKTRTYRIDANSVSSVMLAGIL